MSTLFQDLPTQEPEEPEMFFLEPPAWPVLVDRLRRVENETNGKTEA